jgi:hypothetical protein
MNKRRFMVYVSATIGAPIKGKVEVYASNENEAEDLVNEMLDYHNLDIDWEPTPHNIQDGTIDDIVEIEQEYNEN